MRPTPPVRTKLTPPEIAKRYGIDPGKVLTWIRSGELRAVTIATEAGRRPRYVVDALDLAAIEDRRAARPAPAVQPRRRR